jgi:hypothetical protein
MWIKLVIASGGATVSGARGQGGPGELGGSPGGVWGRAPAVGGPGVSPPGKFLTF